MNAEDSLRLAFIDITYSLPLQSYYESRFKLSTTDVKNYKELRESLKEEWCMLSKEQRYELRHLLEYVHAIDNLIFYK